MWKVGSYIFSVCSAAWCVMAIHTGSLEAALAAIIYGFAAVAWIVIGGKLGG